MYIIYLISPFIGFFAAGSIKFFLNLVTYKKFSLSFIGLGGMPSNHTTIVTTPLALIVINEGPNSPIVGIGAAILLIVIIDALDLRNKVGFHAYYFI